MYFKLVRKNIKKCYKDYIIYFLTLIFGVCVFYTFNSIESQGIMMDLSETKRSAFEAAEILMGYFSVFISFILGFLVIYANNYLVKRRKKEFGIYIILGMEKGILSRMMFLETLLIGGISLVVGIFFGVFLSQGLSVLTAYMFQVDLTKFTFVFSKSGFIKTVLCFSLIYLVVLIFNFLSIRNIKLIDLLRASKINEKQTIKNLWVSEILFLVSLGMIGTAYYKVLHDGIAVISNLGTPILLGVCGTFIFFYSLTGFFLKVIQSNKKIYFRDLNMFVMKQISSKINTAFISISIICLMLFLAICTFSGGLGINRALNSDLKDLSHFDVSFWNNTGINIEDEFKNHGVNIRSIAKEDSNMVLYNSGVKYSDFLSRDAIESIGKNLYPVANDKDILVMDESGYNDTLKILGEKSIDLKDNQYLAVGNVSDIAKCVNEELKESKEITISGKKLVPSSKEYKNINLNNFTMKGDILIFVVNDSVTEGLKPNMSKFNIIFNDGINHREELEKIRKSTEDVYIFGMSREEVYDNAAGTGAMMAYLGIYLGLIFIMTAAVVLAIQQLTETSENVERYRLLRELGVDDKMINKALFTEIGIYFMLPLSLAIVHSIVGLKVSSTIVRLFGEGSTVINVIITAVILIIIYSFYFLATYLGAKKNIKDGFRK